MIGGARPRGGMHLITADGQIGYTAAKCPAQAGERLLGVAIAFVIKYRYLGIVAALRGTTLDAASALS